MPATASNRDLRRTASTHADVLEKFGACLDSQADAIKGLAENQRVLMTAMQAWNAKTRWERLKWMLGL